MLYVAAILINNIANLYIKIQLTLFKTCLILHNITFSLTNDIYKNSWNYAVNYWNGWNYGVVW